MSRRNQRTKTLCRRGNPTYKDERQIRGLFRGYRPDAVTANEREADRLVVPFVKVRPPVLHEPAQLFLRPPVTKRLVFDRRKSWAGSWSTGGRTFTNGTTRRSASRSLAVT